MREPTTQEVLETIIEKGWAEPQGEKYAQKLRETNPDIRRLLLDRPNLAETHVVARYNEDHVHEFSQLPKQAVEALIQFLAITAQSDRKIVHLDGRLDADIFPVEQQSTTVRCIAFMTPSYIDLATTSSRLFLGHHSRYMLEGLAVEVVAKRGEGIDTKLHLKVAAWSREGVQPQHQFGIITIETDGTISYKRFALELDLRFVAEASFGVKPKESLVASRPVPMPPGGATNLDAMFPGAKDRLAEDLPQLPGFITEVAHAVVKTMRIPGF